MKPWLGAAAVAAAMLLAPAAALAGVDDPALLKFRVPSGGPVQGLRGARPRHEPRGRQERGRVDHRPGVGHRRSRSPWVQAQGYQNGRRRPRQVQHRPHPRRARRGHRGRGRREARRSPTNAAGKAGPSAAPGTVRAQRGDFYENNVGRFISIEANTTQASVTCTSPSTGSGCAYTGPVAPGRRVRRQQQPDRPGRADDLHRPGPDGGAGLLPVPLPDLPDRQQGRRRPGSGLREGLRAQRRRRHDRRQGVAAEEPARLRGGLPARLQHALLHGAGGLPARPRPGRPVPEHRQGDQGSPSRRGATSAARRPWSATSRPPT